MDKEEILLISSPSPYAESIISHRLQGLPPLGLGYIATWLNNNNYNCSILDMNLWNVSMKDLKNRLLQNSYKIIGISTTTDTYKNGLEIARVIKEYDESIVVFMGGPHVTYEYEDALKSGNVDVVIRNEGEITTKELCDLFLKGQGMIEEIDGISYIDNNKVISNKDRNFICDLDSIPFPDRTLFSLKDYAIPASISSSRGCPGRCIFCAASRLSGGKYRTRSAENIILEIKYLKELGFNHIQIVDDTMTADVKRFNKFLDLMIYEDINVSWSCESRVDIITKSLLMKMKKAGCIMVQFGVEAASQKMLDCLKKNVTIEQITNAFTWCNELEINTASCLIIGQPFDTEDTIKETIAFGLYLQKLGARIVFSISTPYPGTYMYDNQEELGIEIVDSDFDDYTTMFPVYNSRYLTASEIQQYFFDAYWALSKGETTINVEEYRNKLSLKTKELYESKSVKF